MVVVSIQDAEPSIPLNPIKSIIQTALEAADPYRLITENLEIKHDMLRIGDQNYSWDKKNRIIVVGLGKASVPMARAAEDVLGERIYQGVCICKHLPENEKLKHIVIFESSHPIPDGRSVHAAELLQRVVSNLAENDMVLFLLSGGGSSLACLPAAGIFLSDIQEITGLLLKNGATINEMNCVRKHLDVFKGGGFARMVSPARMAVLVLSDVIGSPLDVIASGPAIEDSSTFTDALKVLRKYISEKLIPDSVMKLLEKGSDVEVGVLQDSAKGGLKTVYHKVIGSNVLSVDAAAKKAREIGFSTQVVTYSMQGEARTAGIELLRKEYPHPYAIFAGGETTVTIHGTGLGGRNLEMALGAAGAVSCLKNVVLVTLATDGEDGPTEAAGAVVSSEQKLDVALVNQCLENNDSFNYFQKTGGLIITGPTGTNVNDYRFCNWVLTFVYFGIHAIGQWFSLNSSDDILNGHLRHSVPRGEGRTGNVRRDDHIRKL